MPDPRRVRIPRVSLGSRGDILDGLVAESSHGAGVFNTLADALAFAAALGSHHKRYVDQDRIEFGRGDPIRFSVFEARDYGVIFDVLGVAHTGDVAVLASDEDSNDRRIAIFESYAAGGLAYLAEHLEGQVDILAALLLELRDLRQETETTDVGRPASSESEST